MLVMTVGLPGSARGVRTSRRSGAPSTRYAVPALSGYFGVKTILPSPAAHSPETGGRAAMSASVPSATITLSPLGDVIPLTTIFPSVTVALDPATAAAATKSDKTMGVTRGNGESQQDRRAERRETPDTFRIGRLAPLRSSKPNFTAVPPSGATAPSPSSG